MLLKKNMYTKNIIIFLLINSGESVDSKIIYTGAQVPPKDKSRWPLPFTSRRNFIILHNTRTTYSDCSCSLFPTAGTINSKATTTTPRTMCQCISVGCSGIPIIILYYRTLFVGTIYVMRSTRVFSFREQRHNTCTIHYYTLRTIANTQTAYDRNCIGAIYSSCGGCTTETKRGDLRRIETAAYRQDKTWTIIK